MDLGLQGFGVEGLGIENSGFKALLKHFGVSQRFMGRVCYEMLRLHLTSTDLLLF